MSLKIQYPLSVRQAMSLLEEHGYLAEVKRSFDSESLGNAISWGLMKTQDLNLDQFTDITKGTHEGLKTYLSSLNPDSIVIEGEDPPVITEEEFVNSLHPALRAVW